MKIITKLTFATFAFTLLFTACSKDDETPQTEFIASEIKPKELEDFMILEEYVPKPEFVNTRGNKSVLSVTRILYDLNANYHYVLSSDAKSTDQTTLMSTYNATTGITSINTNFGFYDLTRDNTGQIIVLKSRNKENSIDLLSTDYNSRHIQLLKITQTYYYNSSYKRVIGNGYYRFRSYGLVWKYGEFVEPQYDELNWSFTAMNNMVWRGKDGGSAQYRNLFVAIPKGNGWKGDYKDKDLLLVNTLEKDNYKAVGDFGICTPIN
ncbi:hypothetical protein [Epilithonimonas hispanica]|uniref:hypothetical protein n=1 Tax=Epilithonimonas hispanica TaxID=358687 RepID=UPI000F4E29CC|nr:hypothetical protein [Epilithonimonas hispanica]